MFLSAVAADTSHRPNILFAFADDWGRHASIYAQVEGAGSMNDVIKTPNFDRVAKEGVLFTHAFVNAPSCTPCRSSILSGQYFWRTGRAAILQGAVWDSSIPAYPLLLRDSGYEIGKSFKVWSPGRPVDAPYGGQKYAYEKGGRGFNQFSQNVTRMVKEGKTSMTSCTTANPVNRFATGLAPRIRIANGFAVPAKRSGASTPIR